MSAKTKILIYIGSLFAAIIFLISFVSYTNFESSSVDGYTQKLDSQAFLISKAVEQKILRYFDVLKIVAETLPVDASGGVNETQLLGKLTYLQDELGVLAAYVGLENGDTYLPSSNGLIANFNAKELKREWYIRAFNNEINIMTVPYISTSGDKVMALAVPVRRDGKVVAVLSIDAEVNAITQFISSLSKNNQIFVNRKDGYILASNNPQEIGKNLYEIHSSYKAHKDDAGGSHSYTQNNEDYFVVNASIGSLQWTVWAWDRWSKITEASRSNLVMITWIAFIMIVVFLGIIMLLITKLMYVPIGGEPKEIESIVKKVAQGDLTLAGKETGHETGIYAAILLMISNLKASIEQINDATVEINGSSKEMSDSSSVVNKSSERQMLQLEQTSTAMNEMTVTVDEVAKNALQASTAAEEALCFSNEGISVVGKMNASIATLVTGIEEVVVVTTQLEEETQSIGSILDVIDGISEQTNLLALNAAIEAARAGEQGRGFAVVADEVRNLANRTKESTNEIQDMISRLQGKAGQSATLMKTNVNDAQATADLSNKANEALEAIRGSVSIIQDMNNQIATAAEEQTHVAAEINVSVVEINDLAKETFDSSEKNNTMAGGLSNIANVLRQAVKIFKL